MLHRQWRFAFYLSVWIMIFGVICGTQMTRFSPLPIFFFLFYAAYRNKLSKVCWHPFPRSRVPPVRGDLDTDLRLSLLVLDGGVRDFYSRVYLARSASKKLDILKNTFSLKVSVRLYYISLIRCGQLFKEFKPKLRFYSAKKPWVFCTTVWALHLINTVLMAFSMTFQTSSVFKTLSSK